MKLLAILIFLFYSTHLVSQKFEPFIGTLEYEIKNISDTSVAPKVMHILSLDSLIRIETNSIVFGNQSYIKHLTRKKSYLLISLGEGQDFAIKGDFSKEDTVLKTPKYVWKKKYGSKKIGGMKGKKLKLTFLKSQQTLICYYNKKHAPKYQDAYTDFPGLPILYYIESEDGILEYRLKKFTTLAPNYDLFGIPSNYKKITFDEFVDLLNSHEK